MYVNAVLICPVRTAYWYVIDVNKECVSCVLRWITNPNGNKFYVSVATNDWLILNYYYYIFIFFIMNE